MNKEDYWKLKWALELAKPKDNYINYNQYANDVLQLMAEEENNQSPQGNARPVKSLCMQSDQAEMQGLVRNSAPSQEDTHSTKQELNKEISSDYGK